MSTPASADPVDATVVAPHGLGRPGVRAIVRHVGHNLMIATFVPSALFYACLVTVGLWMALIVALTWCYATVVWRLRKVVKP